MGQLRYSHTFKAKAGIITKEGEQGAEALEDETPTKTQESKVEVAACKLSVKNELKVLLKL